MSDKVHCDEHTTYRPNCALCEDKLADRFEDACDQRARLYAQGEDTTALDAEVDRLMALFESQS